MNAHQIAQRLLDFGLAPVELRGPNDPKEAHLPPEKRGKAPFVEGWTQRKAPASLDDLPDLTPECNVGIRTGRVTGAKLQLVAVDIDSEKANWWAKEHLPPTPIVTLSGRESPGWRGQHWFYLRPKTATAERVGGRSKVRWVNDFSGGSEEVLAIDVKADEGQVVAPGSVHGTGGEYEEALPWTAEALAALPTFDPSWFPAVEAAAAQTEAADEEVPDVSTEEKRKRFAAYLKHCQPSWPSMPPAGAGAYALTVARFACWGLAMEPREAAKVMQESDWNKQCHDGNGKKYPWTLSELSHKCRDASKPMADQRKRRGWALISEEREKPKIRLSSDLPQLVEETVQALAALPDGVFVNGGHLAVVVPVPRDPVHWLNPYSLREWMGKAADYEAVEVRKKGKDDEHEEVVPKSPPLELARVLCARGHWTGVRQLRRVSQLPPVTLSGRVADKPGYDPASRVYFAGAEVDVPQRPTREDALEAAERLFKYVRVVNFREPADRSRWLALVLTLATRTAYETCPVWVHRAAEQNSGKTSCAHVAYGLLYGRRPEDSEYTSSDDGEFAKKVHGWSRKPLVLWDNVAEGRCFGNPKLARIVTNPETSDRELGSHRFLDSDFGGTVFLVTGNNITLDGDLAERALVCSFDRISAVDSDFDPTQGSAFERIAAQGRRDAYTIVRAWAVAGCPLQNVTAHRKFPGWSQLVQQVCVWLGLSDPLSDNRGLNSDAAAAEVALYSLGRVFGASYFRSADLYKKYVAGDDAALEAVGAVQALTRRRGRFESPIALGQALGVLEGRGVYVDGDKLRLIRGPKSGSTATWQVAGMRKINAAGSGAAQNARKAAGGAAGQP